MSIANATPGSDIRQLKDAERSFLALARNEEWLADNSEKIVHVTGPESVGDGVLAEDEEQALRCIGASVMLGWDTIPAKLQNEILDRAGSMADQTRTPALRGRIASVLRDRNMKSEIQKRMLS